MSDRFTFSAAMPALADGLEAWKVALAGIEDVGYDAVAISDHVIGGWSLDPITMLAAAAMATSRVRLRTMVLANDHRHPVFVHRAMSTIDSLSQGRVEIGLGAGWWREEYAAVGLRFDPPGQRIRRLEESVCLIKQLFEPGPVTLAGDHYHVRALNGLPAPVQRPRPPIFIGGGGPSILALAGREADIAGINPSLGSGVPGSAQAIACLDPPRLRRLIDVVRSAADLAERTPPRLQMSLLAYDLRGSDGRRATWRSTVAPAEWQQRAKLPAVPGVLVGSTDECIEQLEGWREEFGIVDIHVGGNAVALRDIVGRLAGR
ncbi:MAG TPA: TIGR03621 family F420-dependent LLM class oxidoreductase [Acidimicrobiales bacterium]|jgi:probable F420-dependent oxidoreductase|nr:TIGR03621 family F420-dependent LLM class oxidoreductase [Acidimicrobiales bacterium]